MTISRSNLTSTDSLEHLPTREGYDRWAEIYDDEENPLIALEEPLTRGLLGDLRGKAVIDVGCGTGRHALWMAAAGARVQALDFSEAMLLRGRRKAGEHDVVFHCHDLAQRLPFEAGGFDRVLCSLVLDHISDLAGLFREVHRVCKVDGSVVVSVMHPAMMLRGVQARFRDPVDGREIRPASCAHQISDYVTAAVGAGFALDYLSEHAVDDPLAARVARARKYLYWPLLFLMRMKVPPPVAL